MERKSEDRLSSLPKDIVADILNLLPLQDALRTNVLSSFWRYQWMELPDLVFDRDSFPLLKNLNRRDYNTKLETIVDHVLLLHQGAIHKFKLYFDASDCPRIDLWILLVARSGIRNLIIENFDHGKLYKVPSCLFSCKEIVYLKLQSCELILPASFNGFNKLKTLFLRKVRANMLEKLISSSPSLNKLELFSVCGCSNLNISASNLVELVIHDSEFKEFYLEKTPQLLFASMKLKGSICKLINILDCVPNMRILHFLRQTGEIVSKVEIPARLHTVCQLSELSIDIDFEDMWEIKEILCVFRSSPYLEYLDIKVCPISVEGHERLNTPYVEKFWELQDDMSGMFTRLQIVNVADFMGSMAELNFIQFVLTNAPILEKLNITMKKEKQADLTNTLIKINKFRRISPKVEVVVLMK